jgi:hypothetical protein
VGKSTNWPTSIVVDESDNVYVAGKSIHHVWNGYYDLVKYNSSGVYQWVARYRIDCELTRMTPALSFVVDDKGNVYMTMQERHNYLTVKHDSSGFQKWAARYGDIISNCYGASALTVDGFGDVYVSGSNIPTIKYNTAGVEQWVARDGYDASAIAVDGSGNVYITGISDVDYITIKFNNAGVTQWIARYKRHRYDPEFYQPPTPTALVLDNSRNVYIAGSNGGDYVTIKYNNDGITQWVALYDGPGEDERGLGDRANALAVDHLGNVYVTGRSMGDSTWSDYATIKYNSGGVIQWVAYYSSYRNSESKASAIAVDALGNVYVTGDNGHSCITVKYNSSGIQEQVYQYGYGRPTGTPSFDPVLAVDGLGNIYVACRSGHWRHNPDYWSIFTVIKYPRTQNSVKK